VDVTNWTNEQVERLVNDLYGGVVSPARLPVWLYQEINNRLMKSVLDGFGGGFDDFQTGSSELDLLEHYRYNVAIFSGAKTHQQVVDMTAEIFKDGQKQPFSDFKQRAGEIFDTYNKNWLLTEYNMAHQQALFGRKWNDYVRDADVFPKLKYVTSGDGRVRPEHAILDGIVRPINDPFWRKYYPPNDWGCRCGVEQMTEDDESTPDGSLHEITKQYSPAPLFNGNVGIDKIIYSPEHPYFRVADRYKFIQSQNFNLPTPPKPKVTRKAKEKQIVPAGVSPELAAIQKQFTEKTKLTPDILSARGWRAVNKDLKFAGGDEIPTNMKRNGQHWFHSNGKIYMNTRPERWRNNPRWRSSVSCHEIGHAVHSNLGEVTSNAISKKFEKYVSEMQRSFRETFKDKDFISRTRPVGYTGKRFMIEARQYLESKGFSNEFANETAGIMFDVIGGLTQGTFGGGHDVRYYQMFGGKQGYKEVFANMFDVVENKDDAGRILFEKFWPEGLELSKKYFDQILK